ncbi:MAG: Lrp/AsnC family transcriptional regulator [Bacteroidota bacterium]|nr:Lrp/AsnC family transcriptional regulator [Bacteroidota bacterium]
MGRIDQIDARILELLQERGRIKRNEIADDVGLSLPSVSERMRKLAQRGVIDGYHAVVNSRRVGFDILAFIRVMVDGSRHYDTFVERACQLEEVQEVHSITGDGSHILRVLIRNTSGLEQLLSTIQSWPGVHGTSTSIVLSSFKDTRTVPVAPIALPELPEPDA